MKIIQDRTQRQRSGSSLIINKNVETKSHIKTRLRWGWVFLEQTRILIGIQFTRPFVDSVFVETKRFVGSNVNVILTLQTCGQRSCMSAGSKRRALEHYFYERICHMFRVSKWNGDWDLGMCTFRVLAKSELLRNARFRFFLRAKHLFFGSHHCAAVLISQVPSLYLDIQNIQQIRS